MALVRILLVFVLALSTSLSSVVAEDLASDIAQPHSLSTEAVSSENTECCQSGADIVPTCHHVQALELSTVACDGLSQTVDGNRFYGVDVFMTGTNPSGPLKPPRRI